MKCRDEWDLDHCYSTWRVMSHFKVTELFKGGWDFKIYVFIEKMFSIYFAGLTIQFSNCKHLFSWHDRKCASVFLFCFFYGTNLGHYYIMMRKKEVGP